MRVPVAAIGGRPMLKAAPAPAARGSDIRRHMDNTGANPGTNTNRMALARQVQQGQPAPPPAAADKGRDMDKPERHTSTSWGRPPTTIRAGRHDSH
jgi:hypothetical protein